MLPPGWVGHLCTPVSEEKLLPGEGKRGEIEAVSHTPSPTDLMVVANTSSFPSSIVTTGVTLVELKAVVRVPAHVEDGDAKRSLP